MILFKRMMDNGATLNPGSSTYKSHWAITGWIVPFLSLVRPFQVVRQIWETSRSGDLDPDRRPLPGRVEGVVGPVPRFEHQLIVRSDGAVGWNGND